MDSEPVMRPIEYRCDRWVYIRLVSRGDAMFHRVGHDYWYLRRRMFSSMAFAGYTAAFVLKLLTGGLSHWMWTGEKWDYHTPKQFGSAELAFAEYLERIWEKPNGDESVAGAKRSEATAADGQDDRGTE